MGGVAAIPISKREMSSTFRVADGVLGEHHMYMVYYMCFSHIVATFDGKQRSLDREAEWNGNKLNFSWDKVL